jgi:hypothetical protein
VDLCLSAEHEFQLLKALQVGSREFVFNIDLMHPAEASTRPEMFQDIMDLGIGDNYDSDTNCSGANSFPGLLVSKVDARAIRTCAQYDALNRQTNQNYSNSDTAVTTTYDQTACLGLALCSNIGRRTSMTDAAGSEIWSYDVPDRIHKEQRTTSGITKSTTYNLDYAGNVTSVVYPTGRTVNYCLFLR